MAPQLLIVLDLGDKGGGCFLVAQMVKNLPAI